MFTTIPAYCRDALPTLYTPDTCSLPVNFLSPGPIHQFWVLPIPGYKAGLQRIATLYLSALVANFHIADVNTSTDKLTQTPGIDLQNITQMAQTDVTLYSLCSIML